MKRNLPFFLLSFLILFVASGGMSAVLAQPTVTVGNATVAPGATDFTVDVAIDDQSDSAIRGVEINIGYDSNVLTFKSGAAVDGTWFITNIAPVAVDATNTQSGQLKILLSAVETGVAANTAATLARLTFDISAAASQLSYPLEHLTSSPGLRDPSLGVIAYNAVSGNVFVTGIPTGAITLTPDPASITANNTSTSTITSGPIKDAANNTVPDGTKVTVATDRGVITTPDADDTLPGKQVLTTDGVITFTLRSDLTVGDATVTANSVSGDATGTVTVAFTAVPAVTLEVTGMTDPVVAGTAGTITVRAVGEDNLTATGYTGTVAFTSTDGAALLPANYAFVAGDNGLKTFTGAGTLTLRTVGEQTVTVTDTATATITGSQTGITVTPAAANKMTLETNRTVLASDTKGTAELTVRILDQYNNLVTSDDTTVVTFALSDATYLQLSSATATASGGVATLTVATKEDTVANPPATSTVTITSDPVLTPPAGVELTIVNFSITVNAPIAPFYDGTDVHLVTSSTATFAGMGGTAGKYRWALASVGEISSTDGDTTIYTAPTEITPGVGQFSVKDTLNLTDADAPATLNDAIDIYIYNSVAINMADTYGMANGGTLNLGALASGGTGAYSYQSSDAGVATVAADGTVTAVGVGTCTIEVRDATYGAFGTDNGFRAVTPTIQVVAPVVVTGPAVMNSAADFTFTAAGGTGQYEWEATDGAMDPDTGDFTAPTVATGSLAVTITAYDKTFNKASDSPVMGQAVVTVFAPVAVIETPAGYDPLVPATWPLLKQAATLTAADATRQYTWEVLHWDGTMVVVTQDTGAATFALDPDALFAASGAGVYTVKLTDKTNPTLATSEVKVRVPLRFSAAQFGADSGTYGSNQGVDTFTVQGGPVGIDVYYYDALNTRTGAPVTAENCGTFVTDSPTVQTNNFTFTDPIEAAISFRVRVFLDPASNDADVARLIAAELDEIWSGIFTVIPVVNLTGKVVDAADGATAIAGAVVTATHDTTVTATTIGDGSFTIAGIQNTGATYNFYVRAAGFIAKTVTMAQIQADDILLEALAPGSAAIAGTVTPFAAGLGPVKITARTAADAPVTADSGAAIEVLSNPVDGAYEFPIPAAFVGEGPFNLAFNRAGWVPGNLTNVAAGAGNDITLLPVTVISVVGEAQDSANPAGTDYDQVLVKITATPAFNNTATEIDVTYADDTAVPGLAFNAGDSSWRFIHPAYENFSIIVTADTSETPRDVDTGYFRQITWNYVKSVTAPATTVIANPTTAGGTVTSGDTTVQLLPGSLKGDVRSTVTIAIAEANAAAAGATMITGSEIVEVVILDENGVPITSSDDIDRIWITMKFDPTVVTAGSFESGAYVIYQANNVADLAAGNAAAIPYDGTWTIDYANGFVTFWVDHLSAFGIGGGGGSVGALSGSSCFIDTTSSGTTTAGVLMALGLLLAAFLSAGFCAARARRED